MPVSQLHLAAEELHLWVVDMQLLREPQALARCQALLDDSELRRMRRFKIERHRERMIISRGVLRSILSRYAPAVDPVSWHFRFNDYGRPSIAKPEAASDLQFNLSHSGQYLVVAVARESLLGVDVEMVTARERLAAIAHRHFSPLEYQSLLALTEEARLPHFYALWTLKEAYLKALGLGLTLSLRQFSFLFPTPDRIRFETESPQQPGHWQFWTYARPELRMAAAVCSQQGTLCEPTLFELRGLEAVTVPDWPPAARSG